MEYYRNLVGVGSKAAKAAIECGNTYAPYSRFKVGAAILIMAKSIRVVMWRMRPTVYRSVRSAAVFHAVLHGSTSFRAGSCGG